MAVREDAASTRPRWAGRQGRDASDNPMTREIERLAKLSRVDYEQARKEAAKALGFRAIGARRSGRADARRKPKTEEAVRRGRAAQQRIRPGAGRQQGGGDEVRRARPSSDCCRPAAFTSGSAINSSRSARHGDSARRLLAEPSRNGGNMPVSSSRHQARAVPATYYNLWQGFAVEPRRKAIARNSWRTSGTTWPAATRRPFCGSSAGGRRSFSSLASRWKPRWRCAAGRKAPARPSSAR